jgi:ADP-ribosyl-[dinitrogen reductase] hydrolase
VLGCLLGGALGDAWGGPFEGRIGPVDFEIPPFPVLSDETQLTLATCQSIVQSGEICPENIARHFLRWYKAGQIHGMGSSTLKAMRDLATGTHWALAGGRGEFAAGNGAAMRVAPLGFILDPTDSQQRVLIRDVCRITHHNDEAYVGGLAVVLAVRAVLTGAWSPEESFLDYVANRLPDSGVRDRIQQILSLQTSAFEVAARFGATGHVVDSVPLALYCAQAIAKDTLPAVIEQAISVGGDTDTIASITGQLAGMIVGFNGVPLDLFLHVRAGDNVLSIAHEFAEFVSSRRQ